jgi:hypothetical protein
MRVRHATTLLAIGVAIGCGPGGSEITPGPIGSTSPDPEWRDLFDGESLEGWRQLGGAAEYSVEDGAIVGSSRLDTPNSFLATEESFGDFVLELEFKVDPELNSGIQIRSLSNPDYEDGRVHGYQIEIDPSERAWTAGIYDEARRGWLYPLEVNAPAQRAFRQGEWNRLRVEAIGPVLQTWLNDVPAARVVDDMTLEGFIALQVHSIDDERLTGKQVQWRNLRIRAGEMEPSESGVPLVANYHPNSLDARERALGWRLSWDGSTTRGWRGAHAERFPETGWQIDGGVLSVLESGGGEAAHGGDIVTDAEYSAFELQLDFRLSEGANSGIKYFVTEGYDAGGGSAIGLEYQLLDDERHPDAQMGRDGNRKLAALYDLIPATKEARFVKPPGKWNHARLAVFPDGRVEHWLNHRKVLEYVKGSPEFLDRVADSKYKDWAGFGLWERGHLLLQDHGNRVSFRSIKLRNLAPGAEADSEAGEEAAP